MKNSFEIRGEETAIFLKQKDGAVQELLISTSDFPKVKAFPNTWFAVWRETSKCFYASGHLPKENNRIKTVYFHRWLMDCPEGLVVDHANHNGLDNRRRNLRILEVHENQQNRHAEKCNSSGFKGVTWHKQVNRWMAQIECKGKHIYLGLFKDKEEAAKCANRARAEMMPYSPEALELKYRREKQHD